MICELHHPYLGVKGCEVCGEPSEFHPRVAGRPEHPFDPCPELDNPLFDAGYRRGRLGDNDPYGGDDDG